MDAGSYRASFPAPSSHLPLAKTTELCKTLFHSCRLPFPSEFAHFLFQFLIKLKQKAAKKEGGNANYTAPASLHSSLSLSFSSVCSFLPLHLLSLALSWTGAPPAACGIIYQPRQRGRNISSSSCTQMENCCNRHVKSKGNFTSLLVFHRLDAVLLYPACHLIFSCRNDYFKGV